MIQADHLVAQVVPARAASSRDLPALETTMQALALDERSPIALEIAATPTTRQFLVRAEEPAALGALERQLQARYPQAWIVPSATDPLVLAADEECSVMELRPGAASYLPLRTGKPRDLLAEGTDPLLGMLAAFGALAPGTRAVAQLALVPAAPTWSAQQRRYALEHPLAQERVQAQQHPQGHSLQEVLLLVPVVLLLLACYAGRRLLPHRVIEAISGLFHGQAPQMTAGETATVILGSIILLCVVLGGLWLCLRLTRWWASKRLYDQRLAEEKTARPAYRARLRVYVIAPGAPGNGQRAGGRPIRKRSWRRMRRRLGRRMRRWQRRIRHGWLTLLRTWASFWQMVASRRWRQIGSLIGRQCLRQGTRGIAACRQRGATAWRQWQVHRQVVRARRMRRRAREALLRLLVAPYRQFHLATGGYFVPRVVSSRRTARLLAPVARRWFRQRGWASDVARSTHLLSVADLAILWHLPQAQDLAELPLVETVRMKTLPAPARLSTGAGYLLGTATHAGQTRPVFLPYGCLRQNLLAAASTGKGKSTLFAHLLSALAQARLEGALTGGALLVDPHGDLANQVAGSLPAKLADEIVFLRLADRAYPVGFNPLDLSLGGDRDKLIDNLIGVIEALWPTSYGPRTESYVEYGCKTLAEANLTLLGRDPLHGPDQQWTLLDLVPLFRNDSFRHGLLEQVNDQHLVNWWQDYFEKLDGRQQAEYTSSLVTKLAKFASTRISRHILGQPRSSLDFAELIRQDRIILLSCDIGEVGADLAALFGSLFVGFFLTALAEQARLAQGERHRVLVLIDEFQVLAGINYQTMLAELRKYGGSFGLATQSLAYLDRFERTLRATVLANVEHLFAFAMADEDARLLHLPGLEPDDITQLPNYTCYSRLSVDGERLPVFSLRLQPSPPIDSHLRDDVLARTRRRYGHPVGVVEQVVRECEARQHTMRPQRKRKGGRGTEVQWSGTGEERVAETLEAEARRQHERGKGGKGEHPQEVTIVQPLLYTNQEREGEDVP